MYAAAKMYTLLAAATTFGIAIAQTRISTSVALSDAWSYISEPTSIPSSLKATNDDDIDLECYQDYHCYGVDRIWAASTIDWFCGVFVADTHTMTDETSNIMGSFFYAPVEYLPNEWSNYDEGVIEVSINVTPGAACDPSVTIDHETCRSMLREPLDSCNTGGVNGKQGGTFLDASGCFNYTLQPNPVYWPECREHSCAISHTCNDGGNWA